jgi:hypothetical protein
MRALLLLCLMSISAYAQVPQSQHVWIITEENHSYESVIGNTSMPYYNSIASKIWTRQSILFADAQLASRTFLAGGWSDRHSG